MIIDLEGRLNNLSGKYIKQILTRLESLQVQDKALRKVVLDGINDLMRDIKELLSEEDTSKRYGS
jgi:hypothetical protein